jgi:hypothetical protein
VKNFEVRIKEKKPLDIYGSSTLIFSMKVKARFKDGEFVPLEDVNQAGLEQNQIVEINLSLERTFSWKGALKEIGKESVELQHSINERW